MRNPEQIQPPVFPYETNLSIGAKNARLKNGVQVFLIEAGTEEVMRIEFIFRAGLVQEDLPLVATSTNMMLTEGSEHYTAEEINNILDYYGVFLNSVAEKDSAGIVLYFLSHQIEKVLELAAEILFKPSFPDKELTILMKKRLRWYQVNREKVQNLAMDQFFESVFGSHHPYGRKVTEKDFGAVSASLLKDFHLNCYRPDNMCIIVSGRIHDKTTGFLNKYFGEILTEKIYQEDSVNFIKGAAVKNVHIDKSGAVQSAIRIGSATIKKTDPDYPGLKIINTILGGYFGSRLMKNIREEKGLTYGIHSMVSSFKLSGFMVISTEVGTGNSRRAIDEIYNEIRRLQTEAVNPAELEVARNYMTGELLRMFDGPFALAESFKAVWQFDLDHTYYQKLAKKIETITPDEITELANTYYNISELYEIVAGNQ